MVGKIEGEVFYLQSENVELKRQVEENKEVIEKLQQAVVLSLRNTNKALIHANRNEQYSRKNNIKIGGLEEEKPEKQKSLSSKLVT